MSAHLLVWFLLELASFKWKKERRIYFSPHSIFFYNDIYQCYNNSMQNFMAIAIVWMTLEKHLLCSCPMNNPVLYWLYHYCNIYEVNIFIIQDWKMEKKSSDMFVPNNSGDNNGGSNVGSGSFSSDSNIDEEAAPLIASSRLSHIGRTQVSNHAVWGFLGWIPSQDTWYIRAASLCQRVDRIFLMSE